MADILRKNRTIRMSDREWREVEAAARRESERRGESVEPGTLVRRLVLRAVRRINARLAAAA